ncbi:MAG: hypothetical protein ACYTGB_08965 [Planctomycetota bacterium]
MHPVTVYLTDTSVDEVASFLDEFCCGSRGAWVHPGFGEPALYIDVCETTGLGGDHPLGDLASVGAELEGSVGACVKIDVIPPYLLDGAVRDSAKHEHLCSFLKALLARFRGVVRDGYGDHLWALREIAADMVVAARYFLQPKTDEPPPSPEPAADAASEGAALPADYFEAMDKADAEAEARARARYPGRVRLWVGAAIAILFLPQALIGLVLVVIAAGARSGSGSGFWVLLGLGLVFIVMGLATSGLGVWMFFTALSRLQALKTSPERPWRADPRWRKGFVFRARSALNVLACWGGFVVAALFIVPVALTVFTGSQDALLKGVVFVFVMLLPALLGVSVYVTLRWLKYGSAQLVLSEMPVVPGRRLRCTVRCPGSVTEKRGFKAGLKCVTTTSLDVPRLGVDLLPDSITEIHCDHSVEAARAPSAGGTAVLVEIDVPGDLPPTGVDGSTSTLWYLTVSAATPGLNFTVTFELPVFRVSDEELIERRPALGDRARP